MPQEYAQEVPFSYGVAFADVPNARRAVLAQTDVRYVA
jgi:hypothetical protein